MSASENKEKRLPIPDSEEKKETPKEVTSTSSSEGDAPAADDPSEQRSVDAPEATDMKTMATEPETTTDVPASTEHQEPSSVEASFVKPAADAERASSQEETDKTNEASSVATLPTEEGAAVDDPSPGSVLSDPSSQSQTSSVEESTLPTAEEEKLPPVDYSTFTKEELAEAMEALLKNDDVNAAAAEAQRMRPALDQLLDTEREAARQKYIAEGGEEDGFDFRPDATYERFQTAYRQLQASKKLAASDQRKRRQHNLEAKQSVLDRLREFVDSEETQVSMNQLRELQNEWRAAGPVPPQHNRSLWANYHALLDRFYDNRSIYYELKELDRKKNLELKQAISERAEALVEEADLRKAVTELDELHEEYKHIGPVPKEEQEPLWQRFKAASDKIHDRRRESAEKFKGELEENLTKKKKLVEEVHALSGFSSDSIKEWNRKTKEVQALKQQWEAIGSMPRKKAKAVNRDFWSHFKQFFAHKGEFFKKLDAQRGENLEKKEVLVAKAESLKDSDDWKQTSQELKQLQQQWREIGPVPEKVREDVYRRFKGACDHFFNRRRGQNEETEAEYVENLKKKEGICQQIEALAASGDASSDTLLGLTDTYASIGFVPRNDIRRIQDRFDKAVKSVLQKSDMDETEQRKVKAEVELSSLKSSPGADRKIDQKENQLRRKISQMEDDIALWTNNISFFASSKGADKLKADFEHRIEQAQKEVDQLKAQLDALQDIR